MIPGLGRCPAGGHGNPLQYSSLEKPHGQRSLAGCSPWGHGELDTTERLGTAQHLPGKCCYGSRCAPDPPSCLYAPLLAAPTWGQAGIRPDKLVLDQRSQARRCSVSVTIIQLGAAKFLVQEDAPECPGPVCLIQASHAVLGLHHQVAPPGLSDCHIWSSAILTTSFPISAPPSFQGSAGQISAPVLLSPRCLQATCSPVLQVPPHPCPSLTPRSSPVPNCPCSQPS